MYTGSLGAVSNREDWIQSVDVLDEDGDAVTITGATIEMAVRRSGCGTADLTAETDDGITIASPRFTWAFTEDQMDGLTPGTYDVGIRIKLDGETSWTQLIVATISVVDGVVA